MTAATILIPTFDHGPTLERALDSALRQSVDDVEVFVVGDGVPGITRDIMGRTTAAADRVRFFDNPKGPRHGEVHRAAALREARGRIVCYLSDDDVYLRDHVATMLRLLEDADFAHCLPVWIDAEDRPHTWTVDLGQPAYRVLIREVHNRIPLSCAAHTLEFYRRLPHGWRTTPAGRATDWYMWQQCLAAADCRAVSGTVASVLHFPSPDRQAWTSAERLAEIDGWVARLDDVAWVEAFRREVAAVRLDGAVQSQCELIERLLHERERADLRERDLATQEAATEHYRRAAAAHEANVAHLQQSSAQQSARAEHFEQLADAAFHSRWMRLGRALARLPGLSRLVHRTPESGR